MDTNLNRRYWAFIVGICLAIVVNIYWPQRDVRNAQLVAWEFGTIIVIGFSFFFGPLRFVKNPYPAMFLAYAVISCFTHGMNQPVLIGLTQILLFTLAFYSVANHSTKETASIVKKFVVLIACFNVTFGILQFFGYQPVFSTLEVTGFVGQKWDFGVMCAAALPFALEWNIGLFLYVLIGVFLADKYAVYIPLLACLFLNERTQRISKKFIPLILASFIAIILLKKNLSPYKSHLSGEWELKVIPRIRHWASVLKSSMYRPLDGWGFNSFTFYVFDKRDAHNQAEMHNEWLQMFFEGGAFAIALIFGWVKRIFDRINIFQMKDTETSVFIMIIASFFHSIFHAPNILFLFCVLLGIMEFENAKNSDAWRPAGPEGSAETLPLSARDLQPDRERAPSYY